MDYEIKENNLVYVNSDKWPELYELLKEFSLVPEDICSFLKCDRKYLQRITNEIPHLFLNDKIRQILMQNKETCSDVPEVLMRTEHVFLRNYYYFSRNGFITWLKTNTKISCESLKIDLADFLTTEINDNIRAAFSIIDNYQRYAPIQLSVEQQKEWYQRRDEESAKAQIIMQQNLNDKGKKLFIDLYYRKIQNPLFTDEIKREIQAVEVDLDFSRYIATATEFLTVEELAAGRSRQMGYVNAYREGAIKIKFGEKNSKVLFYIPTGHQMPVLYDVNYLLSMFTAVELNKLIKGE